MKTLTTTLFCLIAPLIASNARAQQQTHLTLPTDGKWDAAGQLALLNRNKQELSRWDHWYSVAAIDGSVGRYWTPHFKTELEVGTAAEGSIDGEESTPVPGLSFPYPRYRDHKLRETTIGATAMYQFFENQWVHPFIGGGVELVRERHVADALPTETIRFSTVVPNARLPPVAAIDSVTYSVRPLVTGGFKFYVTPHAFVRTEVRTSLSNDRPLAL
ncbi:MAG TPA: hypothetical protein VGJ52_07460, partial [Vicinamibacterales bacterium]